jgi:alkanesulfonate monooxygenase SsuD/methylene tetrahydromethanopterin reductase-like flavin-dependent oxidoreductase (luciferase family)
LGEFARASRPGFGPRGLITQRIGIQVAGSTPPADLARIAAEAESLGYAEIWLAEDYFELGGMASTSIALSATQRVPVGLGVVAAVARHPAVTAMELATLAGAFPGRFTAGLGHGGTGWVRQMGLQPPSVLRSLREAAVGIRRLLDGEDVSDAGETFRFDGIRLRHALARPMPLYFGVHGPRSLALSGELADGTLLGWLSSPGYVAWARERIDEGRRRAGRSDPHALVVLCVTAISERDPEGFRRELAAWAWPQVLAMVGTPLVGTSAAGPELAKRIWSQGGDGAWADLPDAFLDEFVAAGDARRCRAMIERLLEAGADRVILVTNPAALRSTSSMVEQIRSAAVLIGSSAPTKPDGPPTA